MNPLPQRLLAFFSLLLLSANLFAGPSHDWLIGQQKSDGSFSTASDIAINHQATGETISALLMDGAVAPQTLVSAKSYIYTGDKNNIETLSRQIIASVNVNSVADGTLVSLLTAAQNTDGGYGSYVGYESDPLSTAWALRALASARINSIYSANAATYLISKINTEGGWQLDAVSSVALTSEVMLALNNYKSYSGVSSALSKARSYLWSLKQLDNLWGDTFESALAISALSLSAPTQSDLQPSLDALNNRKLSDASWESDVYTTALALQAIKRANSLSGSPASQGNLTGQLFLAGSSIPVANAQITVNGVGSPVVTDANGKFTLSNLSEGLTTVGLQKIGFQPTSKASLVVASATTDIGPIYISAAAGGAIVGGRAFDSATGGAVVGASLKLSGVSNQTLASNAFGNFEATSLMAGSYTFEISAPGYYSATGTFNLALGAQTVISQPLVSLTAPQVTTPTDVTGIIVDGQSQSPVSLAVVTIDGIPTFADISGQFVAQHIARGEHQVSVSATGYLTGSFSFNLAPGASGNLGQLPIYLVKSGAGNQTLSVLAKCVDGVSGAPVFGATLTVKNTGIVSTTDAQGFANLNSISNLNFTVSISANGYIAQEYIMSASGFGSVAGTFALTPSAPTSDTFSVSGIVKDNETHEPIAGATLTIPGVVDVTSGADGSYKIEGVQRIPFTLRVLKDGYMPYQLDINVTEEAAAYIFDPLLKRNKLGTLFSVESLEVPATVEPDSTITIRAVVKNLVANSQSALIIAHVMDLNGAEVASLLPLVPGQQTTQANFQFGASESISFNIPWSVLQTAAGNYSVVVEVVEPNSITRDLPRGTLYSSRAMNTLVSGVSKFAGSLEMSPPLLQAGAKTPVKMNAVLRNSGNQLLPAGSYKLSIYKTDPAAPIFQKEIALDSVEINSIAQLDFGTWLPDDSVVGQHQAVIQRTDTIRGNITAPVYVGDVANATFTLDKTVLPVGTSNVKGNIHLTGVDNTVAKSTDPLLDVVKTAVENGAAFAGPATMNWQKTNNCLGCHIQAQTLAGLGSAYGKASADPQYAKYIFNEISTGLRPEGAFSTHEGNVARRMSSVISNWALSEWDKPEESINTLIRGLDFTWSWGDYNGNWAWWNRGEDGYVGWVGSNISVTALTTLTASRVKQMVDAMPAIPEDYQWKDNISLNGGEWGDNTIKSKGKYLYVAKMNGRVERVDTTTKKVEVLFQSTPGVTGPVNGFDFDDSANFLLSTQQGKLLNVNSASGSVIKSSAICNGRVGSIQYINSDVTYFTCFDAKQVGQIDSSGKVTLIASGNVFGQPFHVKLHPKGFLLVTDKLNKKVLKVTLDGTVSVYADGMSQPPAHIEITKDGEVYITGGHVRGESYGVNLIRENGTIRRVAVDPIHHSDWTKGSWSITSDDNGTLYTTTWSGEYIRTLKKVPQSLTVVNNYISRMPYIANYFVETFSATDLDNVTQATRLIGLSEARKHIKNVAQLAKIDTVIKQSTDLLRNRQAQNGGWSRYGVANTTATNANYAPDPLMTALVGIALEYTYPSAKDPMIRNSITYLLNTQQSNGTWESQTGVDNRFTTHLGTTSLVMVYLPKAIERLGGLDVNVALDMPANVTLSNPNFTQKTITPQADGSLRHTWEIKGVTGTGRDLKFDLAVQNLDLGEIRPVANLATLAFGNSFTNETIVKPFDIPSVMALNKLSLSPTTDKLEYNANEPVAISSLVKNLGQDFGGGKLSLSIRAAGYTSPLVQLTDATVGSVLGQQSTTLNNNWNTALTLAGTYEVFGQLFDVKGRVMAEGVASFVIKPSTGNNPALAAQVFNDKRTYTTSESATIEARAINTTTNVDHPASLGKLTVKSVATGQTVFVREYAIPELVIGAFSSYPNTLPLAQFSAGQYAVDWKVYSANGQQLISQAASAFVVVEDLRASIKGSVTAASASVEQGNTQQCDFTVSNVGQGNLDNLLATYLVVNIDTEQVMDTQTRSVSIAPNASDVKTQPFSTSGYTKGNYACVLQAVINSETVNLAQALFTVKEPDIKLDAIINKPTKGRLLVLVDPAKGKDKNASPLADYVKGLLDTAGWTYTIVNNAKDFDAELQQGGYSEYALLSQQVTLTPQTRELLKTKVAAGEGLVVGDGHDRRHQSLEPALGVRVHSKQTHISGVKLQQSPLGNAWNYNFAGGLNSLTFDIPSSPAGATVDGTYVLDATSNNAPHPLGAAAEFNAFVLDNFESLSSAVEGRLAVGGTLNINNFGIGNKLDSKKISDVVIVGGDAIFSSGKVYYGNLLAGGSVAGVGAPVVNGMAKNAVVTGNVNPLPVDFEGEREYLKALSTNIATLTANGTYTYQYGIYTLKGDCSSKVQVFNVQTTELATANTLKATCIPTGATVIVNLLGGTATLKNIGMQDLTAYREKVIFNVPTATEFVMSSVGIQGTVLAPNARFYNPAGSIDGRLIAKSWISNNYGWVGINNVPFTGDLSAAVLKGSANAVAHYRYQNGKTAFVAFDVANQAMLLNAQNPTTNYFAQLLLGALDYANPEIFNSTPGRSMLYTVDVKNLVATPVTTKVLLTLTPSAGAVYTPLLLEGFTPTANANEWSSTLSLKASETLTKKLYVQLPKVAGQTLNLRVQLITGDGANAVIRADKSLPVTVQAP